jgi:hypothetical protein
MSGSIASAWIDGVTYPVKADADFTENSEYENEGIATSGDTLHKRVRQVATVEGIDLIVDGTAKQTLIDVIRSGADVTLGYEEEDGTVNNATGRIQNAGRTTQENTMSVVMIPTGRWEVTAA